MNKAGWTTSRGWSLVWFALALLGSSPAARAQEPTPPEVVELKVGLQEKFKVGLWTPVSVTLRGGSEQLTGTVELITADSDGTRTVVTSPLKQLFPGQRMTVDTFVRFGNMNAELTVVFRVNGRPKLDRTIDNDPDADGLYLPFAVDATSRLYVTLGPSIGFTPKAEESVDGTPPSYVAQMNDGTQLPGKWYGYEGVEAVIIATSAPEVFTKLAPDDAQMTALREWIERGGKLLICSGSQAPTLFAQNAPLAEFAPGQFAESATLRRTAALETYSDSSFQVPRAGGEQFALQAPRFSSLRGVVEEREGDLPLVIRTPRKFGQITFVSVDLDRPPLTNWKGRPAMVNRLLGIKPKPEDSSASTINAQQARYLGLNDIVGQLCDALDQFPGVIPVAFWVVALSIFVYILLIGPGDYFLVKKLLRRMEMTWITFPLIVLLVSAAAYFAAYWTKGNELLINQADVVDVDVESGAVRGTTWLNVFSPTTSTFELSVEPQLTSEGAASESEVLFAWLGRPGNSMNGMGSRQRSPSLFTRPYFFSPSLDSLIRVPIQVWSTKAFTSRWSCQTSEMPVADLSQGINGAVVGTIRNELKIPLTECLVVSGNVAYTLGDLAPGATATLVQGEERDLAPVLKDADIVRHEKVYVQTARQWNVSTLDMSDILRKMMFFDASGGFEHAQVRNNFQPFVDMSDLIKLDRAVLVCKVRDRSGARLTNGGDPISGPQDQHWTVYRFVFPVKPRATP